jgi:protein O-GlcNAc transferase
LSDIYARAFSGQQVLILLSDLHRQGIELYKVGRLSEALAHFEQALAISPSTELHCDRALALWELGRSGDAIEAYGAAIALTPGNVTAHYNRALMLHRLHHLPDALAGYDRALRLRADLAFLWNNRAGVLQAMGHYTEALQSLNQALKLDPKNARAHYNRGALFLLMERYEEAIASVEDALRLDPHHPGALGILASAALKSCDWPLVGELAPQIETEIMAGRAILPPLMVLNYSDNPALQRKSAELNLATDVATAHAPSHPEPLWRGEVYRHTRVRLAYMSSDFREHPVGANALSLFENHDHNHFETIGLFTGQDDGSVLHQRIANAFEHFHYVTDSSDEALARHIREMEVDVLIDLNGQTQGWRPAVYAYRPSPVITTWLGFAGTMGADYIDYVMADAMVAPLDHQKFFSERIWHLPDSYWPAFTPPSLPSVSREVVGLPNRGFVFACFNNPWKIGASQFGSWMRLLHGVQHSILWLRNDSETLTHKLRREADFRGIDPLRLVFAPRTTTQEQHLARQQAADLFLDTFPYNGHTTTAEALAAGRPVVTVKGVSFSSRVAASLLGSAGLPDLVTETFKDYEALASTLARDTDRLTILRKRLTASHQSAPLFSPSKFARDIEAAYMEMLEKVDRRR